LPDIDLARIAPMPREQKRRELERMKLGRPPYTYNPFREFRLDILNVAPGPLATAPRVPWLVVAHQIRQRCHSTAEVEANLQVAKGLYDFASETKLTGVHWEFFPLNIGISEKIVYWSPVVLKMDSRPVVPFFDPRRTKVLTASARQFVFSVMHERIRAVDPDLANVRFAVVQFLNIDGNARPPKFHFDDTIEMLGFEVLDKMVRETYEVWREVLEDIRRRPTGTSGDLGI
jgi:hypothetical protein